MKREIFNSYVEKICERLQLSRGDIFLKTKRKEIVDARYMLYYLCFTRPMELKYIQIYMEENDFKAALSTISYGINVIRDRVENDKDYANLTNMIWMSV